MADTVTCQAWLCHGPCHESGHGSGMRNMARLCDGRPSGITSHQAPTTIWSYPLAFKTQQALMKPPDPPMWRPPPVKTPYIDAVSTAIERSYVSGHWHYSWMTSSPQTMPLLMLYMSSNIDQRNIFCSRKRGAWGKEWKRICKEGRAVAPKKKHPRGKKTRREVW